MTGGTGPKGDKGDTGLRGAAGLVGQQGVQGVPGPQGIQGETGATGATGGTGGTGPTGSPGVCDCLDLPTVNLNNVNINETVTLSGTMTCPGGALDPSCFGLSTCPDFHTCRIDARGVNVYSNNASDITSLTVGTDPLEVGSGIVQFGSTSKPLHTVAMSCNDTCVFASYTVPLYLLSNDADARLEAFGTTATKVVIRSTGYVNTYAPQGIQHLSDNAITNICNSVTQTLDCVNNILSHTATNFTVRSTDFTYTKASGLVWFETSSNATLQPSTTATQATVIAGTSMRIGVDFLQANGVYMMSEAATGLVSFGAGIEVQRHVRTPGTTLQLQNDTTTKYVDVQAALTNGESGMPVTVADVQGVNVTLGATLYVDWVQASTADDPLNMTLHLGVSPTTDWVDVRGVLVNNADLSPVKVNDAEGLEVVTGHVKVTSAAHALLTAHVQAVVPTGLNTVSINTNAGVTITGGPVGLSRVGSLTHVYGDLTVDGTLTSTGCAGCVSSDVRVKTHVKPVAPEWDLQRLLDLPRRVEFRYDAAFRRAAGIIDDIVHHGYIAHEVEHAMPHVVHKQNRTVAGKLVDDFRSLYYDRIVPHAVGAIKALHLKQHASELKHAVMMKEHAALKMAHTELKREVDMMRVVLRSLSNKLSN